MKRWLSICGWRAIPIVIVAVMAVGLGNTWSAESKDQDALKAYEEGQVEAQADINEGRLVVKTYGLSASSRGTYAELLKAKYGVELRAVAGCVVTSALLQSVKGYNEVSQAEIERRFGKGVLKKAQRKHRPATGVSLRKDQTIDN